jgi:hypothetical protein
MVSAYLENGTYFADVSLKVSDRCAQANMRVSKNDSQKLQMKNLIGRAFLNAAEQVFGYKSPFGLFTGIRPAKIAADYLRACSAEETKRILSKADVILFPASGTTAPLIEGSKSEQLSEAYLIGENHLAIGNFTGYPSLTLPSGFIDNMPIGINVTGRAFEEQTVLNISAGIEKVLGYKNQIAKVGGK